MSELHDRISGVLYGQAVGDALGFGTEFLSRDDAARRFPGGVRSYAQVGQRFQACEQWQPGDWTDDTDQLLCILDSLLERRTLDIHDIARRLRDWGLSDGYGMGQTVYVAVHDPRFVDDPFAVARDYWESRDRYPAANGAVMRTSVLGVWEYGDADRVRHNAEQVCRITHADPRCLGSCVAVCLAIQAFLLGASDIEEVVREVTTEVAGYHPEMAEWLARSAGPLADLDLDEGMNPGEAKRFGYTLKTLAAGFWALRQAESFAEGLLPVIDEGGDADTNAAVAGALLGARFGVGGIPREWVEGLVHRERLEERVGRLVAAVGG